jgi:hypothetical protein
MDVDQKLSKEIQQVDQRVDHSKVESKKDIKETENQVIAVISGEVSDLAEINRAVIKEVSKIAELKKRIVRIGHKISIAG